MAIDLLSSYLKIDLRQYPRDLPLPELPDVENFDGIRTLLEVIKGYDPSMPLIEIGRQLMQSSDSWLLAGTAEEIADQLTAIFDSGAADGFNLMFPYLPTDFENFTREVVPLLKQRGVMRQQYAAGNLRENSDYRPSPISSFRGNWLFSGRPPRPAGITTVPDMPRVIFR